MFERCAGFGRRLGPVLKHRDVEQQIEMIGMENEQISPRLTSCPSANCPFNAAFRSVTRFICCRS